MNKSKKFSPEVREHAVRLLQEDQREYQSLGAAVESIAPKIGCVPQTRLDWVKRVDVDSGERERVPISKAQGVKELERENTKLCRADEILKVASAFLPRRGSTADSSHEEAHRRT